MTAIAEICLKGFRNFKSAKINLTQKALVIGANDVGKTNLMYAIRLLLDRHLSEADLEPSDGDFYAHEDTNEFEITLKLIDVTEDCVLAKLKGFVSNDGELYLVYRGRRDPITRQKSYSLHAGHKIEDLCELLARHYTKVLNVRYVAGRRDLYSYLKRERRELLEEARSARSEADKASDGILHETISSGLKEVSKAVEGLTYIKSATVGLNAELAKLSHQSMTHEVVFDAAPFDASDFVGTVDLVCKVQGRSIPLTGDGRANQVHLSLWAARNRVLDPGDSLEVSILCIEEPEAHLHPHQQRKLSSYLFEVFNSQVIVTSHSPQIACEFTPGSIIRLFHSIEGSRAAGDGCNPEIGASVVSLGYRMGVIPAEAIFSSAVLLVEGPSEVLLFRALAKQIEIDLDRLNVSILSVDGIGFKAYSSLLYSLEIPFVIRTDNDVVKIRKSNPDKFRLAGMERAWSLYSKFVPEFDSNKYYVEKKSSLTDLVSKILSDELLAFTDELRQLFAKAGIYISAVDLEHDLYGVLKDELATHYELNSEDREEIINSMKTKKAENMFDFLKDNLLALKRLNGHQIAQPLLWLKSKLETK